MDDDLFGRPYLLNRNKLQSAGLPITETLPTTVLQDVVAALFPMVRLELERAPERVLDGDWDPAFEVTSKQMDMITHRLR